MELLGRVLSGLIWASALFAEEAIAPPIAKALAKADFLYQWLQLGIITAFPYPKAIVNIIESTSQPTVIRINRTRM